MRASGIPYYFLFASVGSLLLAAIGCSGSQSDRTVRVSQAPAPHAGPAEPVPSRLAGGSTENASGSRTSPTAPLSATASIDDSGDVVRQASRVEPFGMIGSEGGVDEAQLMEAFRHADPRVREMAQRQARAVTASQGIQSQEAEPSANPASTATPLAAHQMIENSTDPASDSGVPTLPGSQQRVAAARPTAEGPSGPDASASAATADDAMGDAESSGRPPRAAAAAALTASVSRGADSDASLAQADDRTHSAQDPENDSQKAGQSDAADEQEAKTLDEQLAMLDEQKLFEVLIGRYAEGEEGEGEAANLRRRMNHRLLLMMAGRIDEAVEPFEGLAPSEQEYLRHQTLALWTAIDPQGHPISQRRWATALPHLREATSYLAAATGKLDVGSLAFCTEVVSFGRVKPFEVNRFTAGQEVILYSEIDCFAAERLSDGYETHFNGSFEIFDASGKRVADKVLPSDRQSGKNYRRDYFIAYRMHLPSHLQPGSYRMELTIEDLKAKKYGSSSIAFDIEGTGRAE